METPKHIQDSVKNSVGYSEADNKESFMIGASVAFKRSEEYFNPTIKSLSDQLETYKSAYENTLKDFKDLVSIIDRYRGE